MIEIIALLLRLAFIAWGVLLAQNSLIVLADPESDGLQHLLGATGMAVALMIVVGGLGLARDEGAR